MSAPDRPDEGAVIAAIAAAPAVAYDLLDFLAFELATVLAAGDSDEVSDLLEHLERELALPAGHEHEGRRAATRVLLDHLRACLHCGWDEATDVDV